MAQQQDKTGFAAEKAIRAAHGNGWSRDRVEGLLANVPDGDQAKAVALVDDLYPAPSPVALLFTPAEQTLGALLTAGALSSDASRVTLERVRSVGLEASMFERERDRVIFDAIAAVVDAGGPAESLLVEEELRRRGALERAGGAAYVRELAASVPATANAHHFARRVVAAYVDRSAERVGLELVDAARAGRVTEEVRGRVLAALEAPVQLEVRERLVPGGAFILDDAVEQPCVWGEAGGAIAWAAGEGLMVAGPQGVGKTTLMQQLALARCGIRSHVLGMPVVEDERRVLYLAADRPRQAQRSLARMVTELDRQLLDERLVVHRGPPSPLITSDERALSRLAERAGAGTVFIDSLKDVAVKLADDEAGARVNLAIQSAIADGLEVVVGHHQRKASTDNKKPAKLDDVYGSTWITSGLGSVLLLWGEPGDVIVELSHLKQPSEEIGPWNLQHDHVTGMTSVARPPELVDLLFRASTAGLTALDAAALVFQKESPTRNEVEKTRRKLERLVDTDRAAKLPGTKSAADPPRYFYNGGTADQAPSATSLEPEELF